MITVSDLVVELGCKTVPRDAADYVRALHHAAVETERRHGRVCAEPMWRLMHETIDDMARCERAGGA